MGCCKMPSGEVQNIEHYTWHCTTSQNINVGPGGLRAPPVVVVASVKKGITNWLTSFDFLPHPS